MRRVTLIVVAAVDVVRSVPCHLDVDTSAIDRRCSDRKIRYPDDAMFEDVDDALEALNLTKRPSVMVLGVGHSGTSTIAHHLVQRGWVRPQLRLDKDKFEDVRIVDRNRKFVASTRIDKTPIPRAEDARHFAKMHLGKGACWVQRDRLRELWQKNAKPAMWKDPQFVWTLHLWGLFVFHDAPDIVLAHVRRDPKQIASSHIRRGETAFVHLNMTLTEAVQARIHWADFQFNHWSGPAVSFNIASVKHTKVMNHIPFNKAPVPRRPPPHPVVARRPLHRPP